MTPAQQINQTLLDKLTLDEKLVASIAIAKHRRASREERAELLSSIEDAAQDWHYDGNRTELRKLEAEAKTLDISRADVEAAIDRGCENSRKSRSESNWS